MKKLFIFTLLLPFSSLFAESLGDLLNENTIQIHRNSFRSKESIDVYHNWEGFHIIEGKNTTHVQQCWLEPRIRHLSNEQLFHFLQNGSLTINKLSESEYSIRAQAKIMGSGPISAAIAYWAFKAIVYGSALAAAGTVVVATGGLAGAAVGGTVAVASLGAGAGATVVGGAIAGAGGAAVCATGVGAVAAGVGGSIAGATVLVETGALGIAAIFLALPIP